jgi:glycosyltransferase involved in cell wall biosynthesis
MTHLARLKLLFALPSADLGGVSQYLLWLVDLLPHDRFEIHVAGPTRDGPLFEILESKGVITHRTSMRYTAWSLIPALLRFRRLLRCGAFAVLHLHTLRAGFLGCLASTGLDLPIVYTGHGWRFEQLPGAVRPLVFRQIERSVCRRAAIVVALSERERQLGLKRKLVPEGKVALVRTRIDAGRFETVGRSTSPALREALGIPPDALVVGTIGRITYQKDPETFIQVASLLRASLANAYFVWVGDGDLKQSMLALAEELGVADRLTITGSKPADEIPSMLETMDVFLFTSRFEGLPISVLEAMAARRLIVASAVGAIPEVIQHRSTGWLFPSGDATQAAQCIREALTDRGLSERVAERAHELILRLYSPQTKFAQEYQAIYEQVSERGNLKSR